MAKANNSGRTKKSHNYKPYDTSNSFVKRITAKVSEILPQSSSWVSRLFSPAPKINVREREELEEEDEEEEERQPPSKRLCFRSSESNDYTHHNNVNRLSDLDRESGDISPILSSRLDTERDRAVPGPSGLHLRNFVSSTPAVRQTTYESSPKASTSFVKRTPVVDQKKNTNKRSSLNLSSSSTINSSTQPSFDTFVFRNPLNKSGLRPRSSLNDSCFYPGETTFGGASARVLTVDQPKARVVNVTASPTLQRDTIGTSALRILKALEQFSTPVLDAKKIPVRTEGTNLRKRKPPQPYEELIFPTMPELLSLKRREVVSKPTISETEPQPLPSTSTAVTSAPGSSAPPVSEPIMSAPSAKTDYSLRPESTKETHIGSIKGRQKDEELETERVPELNLPNVQLKITSLPKFDLKASKKAKVGSPKNNSVPVSQISPKFKFSEPEILEKISSEKIIPNFHVSAFKFSEPLASIEQNTKTLRSPSSQNKFSLRDNVNEVKTLKMKVPSPNFKLKRKSTETNPKKESIKNFELKNSSEIKTGSVIELFNKNNASLEKVETPKLPEKSSQCSKCKLKYDKNKGKCSCENSLPSTKQSKDKVSETKLDNNRSPIVDEKSENKSKSNSLDKVKKTSKSPLKGFEGYKKPVDTWECKECFVRNKNSTDTCVACSTSRSGKTQNPVNTLAATPAAFTFSSSGNKTDLTKTTTNFVPIVNSIKKPPGQWECNTCLVQNKVDVTSCVACNASKPGSAPVEKPKPTFSFGIPAASNQSSGFQFEANTNVQKNDTTSEKPSQFTFGSSNEEVKSSGFKFGTDQKSESMPKTNASFPPLINSFKKSNDKWECNTCLVQNKNDVTSCVACNAPKPGTNSVEKPKPTFSFGIPNSTSASNVPIGLNLNTQKIETNAVQPQFTFGSQPGEKKSSTPIFKFGSSEPKLNNESKPTFTFMNSEKPKESEPPKPVISNLFSFGSNSKENKTDDTTSHIGDAEKPLKKKVSFGKPLVSEKHISNDTNSSIFGGVISKNNDGSTNFTFPTKSPFENNTTVSKEPVKEPAANTFIFGSTEPNAALKPSLSEPSKPISFSAPPSDTVNLANNEHSNTHNIFGGSFTGFKPPETENKPFSFMGNSQNNQGGQFTFNAVTPAPTEPFGSQQPSSGMPMFNQQQQQAPPAPSLFSQQTEPKPFVFGAPPQHQQQQQPPSFFAFTAAPQQNSGIGATTTPTFGGFTAPSNTAPVFDPNAKPSFNFTGGATPSFSATAVPSSTGDVPEVRRVRKAIRRTTQHR